MSQPAERTRLLLCCPVCTSGLISATGALKRVDEFLFERRCPECGYWDLVAASSRAVAAWSNREKRVADRLEALADALGDGLTIDLSEIAP